MKPTTATSVYHYMATAASTLAQMYKAAGQHSRAQECIDLSMEQWRKVAWEIEE